MAETLGAVTKDGSQWCDYERERQTGQPCTRAAPQLQIQIQIQNALQLVTESRSGSGRTSRSGCVCDVACAPVKVARKNIRVRAARTRESHRLGVGRTALSEPHGLLGRLAGRGGTFGRLNHTSRVNRRAWTEASTAPSSCAV